MRDTTEIFPLFSLPDETKLPIANSIGLRALANAASASQGFRRYYNILFAESMTRTNNKSADQYFDGLDDFSKKIDKLKSTEKNKKVIFQKLNYLLEKLEQAYLMANDMVIKERIARLFNRVIEENHDYFKDENILVSRYLEGLKYTLETINALPHLLGNPTSRREVLIDKYEKLIKIFSDKKYKILIFDQLIQAIELFKSNPPKFKTEQDKLKYLSIMEESCNRLTAQAEKKHGCTIS